MKLPTFDEFVQRMLAVGGWQASNNSYVREPGFSSLYIRLTQRYIEGKRCWPVLDIANVEAKTKSKGTFTALIERIKKDYPDLIIYVESVQTERFCRKLERMGFVKVTNLNSYYLMPEKKEKP